jgi:activator of 2-hydroxyglutaryl-CoA dehydratase
MREDFLQRELTLEIFGVGSTGYGENLFATALDADFHSVETVAHAAAAQHHYPDVEFILDIGGQDMKAIFLKQGVVTGIILNEACSAGCGSFLETYAKSLQVPVEEIADLAFQAFSPQPLGKSMYSFYELQHYHRAEKRKNHWGNPSGALPFGSRKRLHQGLKDFQPGCFGKNYPRPRGNL